MRGTRTIAALVALVSARAVNAATAYVVVALCDNEHQGIVPVPKALGDGTNPSTNLYWGAAFGVRTYLSKARHWQRQKDSGVLPEGVLERIVVTTRVPRAVGDVEVKVVADAWDGRRMKDAVAWFLEAAAGRRADEAHVVAFVGHNGLMDFEAPAFRAGEAEPARAAIVLACASRPYFSDLLKRAGARPLLLTSGLMAPEAYTLDAGLRAWFATGDVAQVHDAAAAAYHRYQRCGLTASRRLFVVPVD